MSEVLELEVDLTSELAQAEALLADLEEEQAALHGLMRAAAERLDSPELKRLRHRSSDIVVDIFSARATLLKLQIRDEELKREHLLKGMPFLEAEKVRSAALARASADETQRLVEAHRQAALAVELQSNRLETNREMVRDLHQELSTLIQSQEVA